MTKGRVWLLLVMLAAAALAPAYAQETAYSMNAQGVRLYAMEDWQVLTRDNLDQREDLLDSLGTSSQVVAASFRARNVLLQVVSPKGFQAELTVEESFFKEKSVWELDDKERQALMKRAEQLYPAGGVQWSQRLPGCLEAVESKDAQGVSVHEAAYLTLYYGSLYVFKTQSFFGELSPEQQEFLAQAASRLMFLGARQEEPPAVQAPQLPEAEPFEQGIAQVNVTRDNTPITLTDPPARVASASFSISGTTQPDTDMRYYINGTGYSRFTSEHDGSFSVLIDKLPKKGKNTVMIQAIGSSGYGSVTFQVYLEQAKTPVAVSPIQMETDQSAFEIQGITLPGAQAELVTSRGRTPLTVDGDGRFTASVAMSKPGDYAFTLRALAPGYLRGEAVAAFHRTANRDDGIASLNKKAKKVSYQKVMGNPEKYLDTVIRLKGSIQSVSSEQGKLSCVFLTEHGDLYFMTADNLLGVDQGLEGEALLTLDGGTVLKSGTEVPSGRLNYFITGK